MYRILLEEGIDLPRYAVLKRDPDNPEGVFFLSLKHNKSIHFIIRSDD